MNYIVYVFVACLSELMLSNFFWALSKMETWMYLLCVYFA